MLTRALFALALICMGVPAAAEDAKVLALGLADHAVTEEELEKGEALAPPRFNSGGVAYAWMSGLKQGDTVEVALVKDGKTLMHNTETLAEDKARLLLLAGKQAVPAGGWPAGKYNAAVTITRDGKTFIEQTSTPTPFE